MAYVIKLKREKPDLDSYLTIDQPGLQFGDTPYFKEASGFNTDKLDEIIKIAISYGFEINNFEIIRVDKPRE